MLVERGGNLVAYVPGFADPQDDHLPAGVDGFLNDLDGAGKRRAQPVTEPLELENFDFEHTNGLFNVIHPVLYCGWTLGRARYCAVLGEANFMKTILCVCVVAAFSSRNRPGGSARQK